MPTRERRLEGRRIRRERRVFYHFLGLGDSRVDHVTPTIITIYDEVQRIDWDAVVAAAAEAFAELERKMLVYAAQVTDALTAQYLEVICPDCRVGKHDACIGRTWSEPLDAEVDCPCAEAGHPTLPVASSHHSMIGTTNRSPEEPNEGTS